jgi:hypothetical protein
MIARGLLRPLILCRSSNGPLLTPKAEELGPPLQHSSAFSTSLIFLFPVDDCWPSAYLGNQ